MKKKTIVIASVLKPVDDTRMFEKFGMSLSDSGSYHVVIIGYPSTFKSAYPDIDLIAFRPFKRISVGRVLAPLKVLLKLSKVKHDILIVNTHELLIVGLLNRIFFGGRIIYDVRENYYRNIRLTNAFPKALRSFLALWVRAKEKLTAPFIDWFILAEKGYQNEFSFTEKRKTVIENKSRLPSHLIRTKTPGKTELVFSGTLAESTGVFQAIDLAKSLHQLEPTITFHIIGYAAHHETYLRIIHEIKGHDFIVLTGGNKLVPHHEIMEALFKADFGIIIYPSSPHTENSMPTKLYEYAACKLPILLQPHKPWIELCQSFHGAIILEEDLSPEDLLYKMKSETFYNVQEATQISWSSEEWKLLDVMSKVIP